MNKLALALVSLSIIISAQACVNENDKDTQRPYAQIEISKHEPDPMNYSQPWLKSVSNLEPANSVAIESLRKSFEDQLKNQLHTTAGRMAVGRTEWALIDTHKNIDLGHTLVAQNSGNIFIQAPHQFSDLHSGKIAFAATTNSVFSDVIFLNAQHRSKIDYSKQQASILNALTQSYLNVRSGKRFIVQIHGFNSAKRRSIEAQSANFIISSGNKRASKYAQRLRQCLLDQGFENTLLYGRDTDELGATKNVIKKQVFENQSDQFLHIEMSLPQRESLVKNSTMMSKFYKCVDSLVN